MELPKLLYESTVRAALLEDVGNGDITSISTVPNNRRATARLLAKSQMVLAGIEVAQTVFELADASLEFDRNAEDGDRLSGHREIIAIVRGNARSILIGERVALNFLQRLSGISTLTASYVAAVEGTGARIVDTRKTTPGLRLLEKYAVRVGGAQNHRFGLSDGILIKDNHIAAAGGVGAAIAAARMSAPHTLRIEIEAKSLSQVDEALKAGADVILLDNMSPADIQRALNRIQGRALSEASGGVNLSSVREIAQTGVNLISVGALTHSAPAVDISLDFDSES